MKRLLSVFIVICLMLGMTVFTEAEGDNQDMSQAVSESYSDILHDETAAYSDNAAINSPIANEYELPPIDRAEKASGGVEVMGGDRGGYHIQCSYNGSLPDVKCAVWTEAGGQDDLAWGVMTHLGGGVYRIYISFSGHGNQKNVKYKNAVYAMNTDGSVTEYIGDAEFNDWTGPEITNVKYSSVDSSGFTIQCDAYDPSGVDYVEFPTWRDGQGGNSAKWYRAARVGNTNTYSVRINYSDYNNFKGDYYSHVYAYDVYGSASSLNGFGIHSDGYAVNTSTETGSGTLKTSASHAYEGAAVTVEPVPSVGYRFDGMYCRTASGTEIDIELTDGKYRFTMPAENVTLYANFSAMPKIEVSYTGDGTGTVTPSTNYAEEGEAVTFDVVPGDSCYLTDLYYQTGDGIQKPIIKSGDTYQISMLGEDITVYANFEPISYSVKKSANILYGNIELSSETAIKGETVTVTPAANAHYQFKCLTITPDGGEEETLADGVTTFSMPGNNVTVGAVFEAIPISIGELEAIDDIEVFFGYESGTATTIVAKLVSPSEDFAYSYQWYQNTERKNTGGTEIPKAVYSSYEIQDGKTPDSYYYYCEVTATDKLSGATSKAVTNAMWFYVRPAQITSASLSIQEPAVGYLPQKKVDINDIDPLYRADEVKWYDAKGGTVKVFDAENQYTASILLRQFDHHQFSDDANVTLNGKKVGFTRVDGGIKVTYEFPQSDMVAPNINASGMTVNPGYAEGEGYVTALLTNADLNTYEYTYQWYKNDSNSNKGGELQEGATDSIYDIPTGFEKGFYYYYCVVTAKRTSDGKTITGTSAPVIFRVGTEALREAEALIIEPVIGETPSAKIGTVGGAQYTAESIKWFANGTTMSDGEVFAADNEYLVKVTLKTSDEYEFEGTQGYINGKAAGIAWNDTREIVLSYTYHLQNPATPSPNPTYAPNPTYTPYPTYTPLPTNDPSAVMTPYPTYTPLPTNDPSAVMTPYPTYTPLPTNDSSAVMTPYPTYTPLPTNDPSAVMTPYPTYTPLPTNDPSAVMTPYPTYTPLPTNDPSAVMTPYPTYTPLPTNDPSAVMTPYPTYTPLPTNDPSAVMTPYPTYTPLPTNDPSAVMTPYPTYMPTAKPTAPPTEEPFEGNSIWTIQNYDGGKVDITNSSGKVNAEQMLVLISKYNSDGVLVDSEVLKFTPESGRLTYEIPTHKNILAADGESVKVMLWDDKLRPMAAPYQN